MKIIIPFLLFLTTIFYRCYTDHSISVIKLANAKDTLFGKTIKSPYDVLMPMKAFIVDDKILIIDNTKDEIIKVFSLPYFKFLFSWGKLGRGPDELNYIDQSTIKVIGNNFEFLDFQKLKTYMVEENRILGINTKVVPTLGSPINGLKKINDSIYIADIPINTGNLEHIIINMNTRKIIKRFGKYPRVEIEIKNRSDKDHAFHKSSISSPNGGKYAAFYTYFNRFKIYDNAGILIKEIEVRSKKQKAYSSNDGKRNIIYNAEPWSSDSYMYVLNINKSVTDLEKVNEEYNPNLIIWDWEGKLISQYVLDKPITSFIVSEEFQKLYGISYLKMNEIYEFDLPDSLLHGNKKYTFTEIENDYYKAIIIKDWISNTQEIDKNRLTQVNGLMYNTCIFYDPKRKDVSLWINVISNLNAPNLSAENYFRKYREPKAKNNKGYCLKIDTISQRITFYSTFKYESVDPSGKKFSNIDANWIWEDKGNVFEVKYYSFDNFEYFLRGVQEIVSSFSAKP